MRIQTLQNSSVTVLTDAFNQAFSDYIVPLKLTDQAMKQKILCDQIDLNLSPGFFIEQKLCGFILHGVEICNGKKIAWNGGTGVIPSCRKQGITAKLYDFILPQLSKIGIAKSNLEVIQSNQPAIHIYRKIGFENVGELLCYKGNVSPCEAPKEIALAGSQNWAIKLSRNEASKTVNIIPIARPRRSQYAETIRDNPPTAM